MNLFVSLDPNCYVLLICGLKSSQVPTMSQRKDLCPCNVSNTTTFI